MVRNLGYGGKSRFNRDFATKIKPHTTQNSLRLVGFSTRLNDEFLSRVSTLTHDIDIAICLSSARPSRSGVLSKRLGP